MYRSSPLLGVGFQNFTEHHERTAHNSFVLCFAELGTVGYFFWMGLLVVSILQLESVRQSGNGPNRASSGCRYAHILLASFGGVLVAAFFLSRSYNPFLYLLIGLAFVLFTIARNTGQSVALPDLYLLVRRVVVLELVSILAMYVLIRVNRLFVS
jgi:hypothetical protein